MTEELVTLETAKLLKDKGFNWKCEHLIDRNKVITKYDLPQSMSCCTEIDDESVEFLCPTLYVAQKWLRKTKNLHIEIYRNTCGYGYAIVKADSATWMIPKDLTMAGSGIPTRKHWRPEYKKH